MRSLPWKLKRVAVWSESELGVGLDEVLTTRSELLGAARGCSEPLGAARGCSGLLGAARGCSELLGAARSCSYLIDRAGGGGTGSEVICV